MISDFPFHNFRTLVELWLKLTSSEIQFKLNIPALFLNYSICIVFLKNIHRIFLTTIVIATWAPNNPNIQFNASILLIFAGGFWIRKSLSETQNKYINTARVLKKKDINQPYREVKTACALLQSRNKIQLLVVLVTKWKASQQFISSHCLRAVQEGVLQRTRTKLHQQTPRWAWERWGQDEANAGWTWRRRAGPWRAPRRQWFSSGRQGPRPWSWWGRRGWTASGGSILPWSHSPGRRAHSAARCGRCDGTNPVPECDRGTRRQRLPRTDRARQVNPLIPRWDLESLALPHFRRLQEWQRRRAKRKGEASHRKVPTPGGVQIPIKPLPSLSSCLVYPVFLLY